MTARRDGGWTKPTFANGPVHRLLADTQEPRCFFRADELRGWSGLELAGEGPHVTWKESAVATRGDGGGLEQAPRHGTKNGRPADAKAIC
jgi:hypothetical protein